MNYYKKVLQNYANFTGRARRSEYWYFALFNFLFTIAASIVDSLLGLNFEDTMYGPSYCLYSLAMFIPGLAVGVRRLHDVGKSGWFFFIVLIPIVGAIWLLVLFLTDSHAGENQYGPNPKEQESAVA